MKTKSGLWVQSMAVFSGEKSPIYRYRLERRWSDRPMLLFVMLNPSTANAETNDPTIARCMTFAEAWGFGGLIVGNAFAFRSTNPKMLRLIQGDPIGPKNDEHLEGAAADAGKIVVAWGNDGEFMDRDKAVLSILRQYGEVHCFGVTSKGQPKHPLYVLGSTRLQPMHESRHP